MEQGWLWKNTNLLSNGRVDIWINTILETFEPWDIWSEWRPNIPHICHRRHRQRLCPAGRWEERDSSKGGFVTDWLPLLKNTTREPSKRLVTFETFDQSDDLTSPTNLLVLIISAYLHTYQSTSHREYPLGKFPETCELGDMWSELWGDLTWPTKRQIAPWKSNPRDLWPLRHWLQFLQLRRTSSTFMTLQQRVT